MNNGSGNLLEMKPLSTGETVLTLNELVGSVTALSNLLQKPLPVRVAYRLSKVARYLNEESGEYDAARLKLCERYGKVAEDGKSYEFEPEARMGFDREFAELMSTPVVLPVAPIGVDELGDVAVTGSEMMALSWLFKD